MVDFLLERLIRSPPRFSVPRREWHPEAAEARKRPGKIIGVSSMIKKLGKPASISDPLRPRKQNKAEAVLALLDEWLDDESGYDEQTWPELKDALDRDRLSARKLFDE
jgi:hypothetical protein